MLKHFAIAAIFGALFVAHPAFAGADWGDDDEPEAPIHLTATDNAGGHDAKPVEYYVYQIDATSSDQVRYRSTGCHAFPSESHAFVAVMEAAYDEVFPPKQGWTNHSVSYRVAGPDDFKKDANPLCSK